MRLQRLPSKLLIKMAGNAHPLSAKCYLINS